MKKTLLLSALLFLPLALRAENNISPETQHAQAAALTDGVDASKAGAAESVAASGGSISDKLSAASASLRTLRPAKPRPPAPRTAPTCSKADWLKKLKAVALIALTLGLTLGILIPAVSSGVSSYNESVRKDACLTVMQAMTGNWIDGSRKDVADARAYLDALEDPNTPPETLHKLYSNVRNGGSYSSPQNPYIERLIAHEYEEIQRAERVASKCSKDSPQAVADSRKALDHIKKGGQLIYAALDETGFWKYDYGNDPAIYKNPTWTPDNPGPEAIGRARAILVEAEKEFKAAQSYYCSVEGEFYGNLHTTEGEWTVSDGGGPGVITDADAFTGPAECRR